MDEQEKGLRGGAGHQETSNVNILPNGAGHEHQNGQARGFTSARSAPQETLDAVRQVVGAMKHGLRDGEELVFCIKKGRIGTEEGDAEKWPPVDEQRLMAELTQRYNPKHSYYVGMAAMRRDAHGKLRNRQAHFTAAVGYIYDDVGTKGKSREDTIAKQTPAFEIESSEGNLQHMHLFTEPVRNLSRMKKLVKTVYGSEYTDGGGSLVTKFVRLPAGGRNKLVDGQPDDFPVTLLSGDTGVRCSIEEAERLHPPAKSTSLPGADDGEVEYRDGVVEYLKAAGLVLGVDPDGKVNIICPWAHEHTSGDDTASVWPVGVGSNEQERMMTGFCCHHEHCQGRSGIVLRGWVVAQPDGLKYVRSGPELEYLLSRWVKIGKQQRGDVLTGKTKPRGDFNDDYGAKRIVEYREEEGKETKAIVGKLGLKFDDLTFATADGESFHPGKGRFFTGANGDKYFNTYTPFMLPKPGGSVRDMVRAAKPFLDLLRHVVPDHSDRREVLDWLADKLQNPAERSYMILMCSNGTQGVGRSTLGKLARKLFGPYSGTASYADITGSWGSWIHEKLLITVDEVKDVVNGYRTASEAYETFKNFIDTSSDERQLNMKYGRVVASEVFANVLAFSNHLNAMRLPAHDRRVRVILNRNEEAPAALKQAADRMLKSPKALAALQWLLLNRDVSMFERWKPKFTEAKAQMHADTRTEMERLIANVIGGVAGELITLEQLKAFVRKAYDPEVMGSWRSFYDDDIRTAFNALPPLNTAAGNGGTMRIDGRREQVRIVPDEEGENVAKWQNSISPTNSDEMKALREEARQQVLLTHHGAPSRSKMT